MTDSGCGCGISSIFALMIAGFLGFFAVTGVQTEVRPVTAPTAVPYEACAWQWATQDLPEVATQLRLELEAAGLEVLSLSAFAFGENCLDNEGRVSRFAAMQTDFQITLGVEDVEDEQAAGDKLALLIAILNGFPAEQLAGPNPGQVTITFSDGSQQRVAAFSARQIPAWVDEGLSGTDLIEAVGGLRLS